MIRTDGQDRTIVSLSDYRTGMQFAPINEVLGYWEGLRCGRQAPLRSEVDPRGIERALEYAFVLERVAPQIARFRLAGMHLNDLMGMEVRGMPVGTFFTPRGRAELAPALEQVFLGPTVVELSLAAETGIGKPALDARLLLLPLRSDLGDISRALGCLVARGQVGRAPRRFDVTAVRRTPVEPGKPLGRVAEGQHLPETQAVGMAEAAAHFRGQPARPGAHLRLVKSD